MATNNINKWSVLQTGDDVAHGVSQYAMDDATQLSNLPRSCAPGSCAFDISTGDIYMLNSQREWKKIG